VKIWTATDVESVLGECTRAIALIDKLVQTTSSEPAEGLVAWGQYLDLEHGANQQWGLYGTAAGTQIVSLRARAAGHRPSAQAQVAGALRLLPEDLDHGHELLKQKRDKDDFDNVLKLAAIAEALRPDSERIPLDNEPPIVGRLREQALGDGGWTTRPQGVEQREVRERDLATAYVLHAWQRYELGEEGLAARQWLARAVLEGVPIEGNDLLALVGLAMTAHPINPNDPPQVREAIANVHERLSSWARSHEEIRVDRPMFSGFSVGPTTDYLFLHPEILAALFFVRQDNSQSTRAFVIEVAEAVSSNIKANDGLKVSNGLKATVDQLWAFRFLCELRQLRTEGGLDSIAPPAGEQAVRERANILWRNGKKNVGQAARLWTSKEAGYRQAAAKGVLVLVPLVLALLVAIFLFKHPAEGIGSMIVGLCVTVGVGYFFFFKEAKERE
jgi:hypothetical protein